jgi:hypothetical protein
MADSTTYAHVTADGYIAFAKDLATDEWGLIDIAPYQGPNRTSAKPMCDVTVVTGWKLHLDWTISDLVDARDGAVSAKDLDKAWDGTQKRLSGLLSAEASSSDALKRAAAARLQKALLLGAGEGQTKLKYQQEVDFGRQQVKSTATGQAAADVALLGLASALVDIGNATEALATGIGHGETTGRPFERVQATTRACEAIFTAISLELARTVDRAQPGADRERALRLRKPFEELAARYPAPPPAAVAVPAQPPGGSPLGGGSPPGP